MRKLMARVVLRSALAISAVGIVAAAGALDAGPSRSTQEASVRAGSQTGPTAGTRAGTQADGPSAVSVRPAGWSAAEPASSYTLKTENGPRAALAARIVTATLLLTGLVLTALGAIGMRGPSLSWRKRSAADLAADLATVCAPARIPRPGSHPRFGPPPT